ncbi:RIO1 family regulatory kinase/ATPase domain-containing protein [Tengunoibacter tsumagoiensis]|uniref:non-specific serine/threonine protein kinase n=1 Tax=Tengunoibacter tsumagoiensis TaxID=2014871 RepID=A0A402A991_9CHLR|nr:RIO1 family regulatory kinase/ATPase [Tengunoibacter tsumagoiensis]GCE15566.1 hypothetical protein KTT_54250 [Tengunoibacter tsumagoiensis]
MANNYEDDDIDSIVPIRTKIINRSKIKRPKSPKNTGKSSNVQYWLREQSLKKGDGAKPPFSPTLPISQQDAPWILSSLTYFYESDLISDVISLVKSGKEATVYCCLNEYSEDTSYVAAKIYRPSIFYNLKSTMQYRQNRGNSNVRNTHDERKRGDSEALSLVQEWVNYEFKTQELLYNVGADVPKPIAQTGNALLMEYIADGDEGAPLLQHVKLEENEALKLFNRIMNNIELFLAHKRIHGDLSAYNILYRQGAVKIIDFSQTTELKSNFRLFPLLLRDIERVCQYFARYNIQTNARDIAHTFWDRYSV